MVLMFHVPARSASLMPGLAAGAPAGVTAAFCESDALFSALEQPTTTAATTAMMVDLIGGSVGRRESVTIRRFAPGRKTTAPRVVLRWRPSVHGAPITLAERARPNARAPTHAPQRTKNACEHSTETVAHQT